MDVTASCGCGAFLLIITVVLRRDRQLQTFTKLLQREELLSMQTSAL